MINNNEDKYTNQQLKNIGNWYIFNETLDGISIDDNLGTMDMTIDILAIGY